MSDDGYDPEMHYRNMRAEDEKNSLANLSFIETIGLCFILFLIGSCIYVAGQQSAKPKPQPTPVYYNPYR